MSQKPKTVMFSELPLGAAFFHAQAYVKISLSMAVPMVASRRELQKIRFKKSQKVELLKSMRVSGKAGSSMEVKW